MAALSWPVIGWAARHARLRAEQRLLTSVGSVGEQYVLNPLWAVLARDAEARAALHEAARR
jgi:hypothetical protein